MNAGSEPARPGSTWDGPAGYEPPRVERALTPAELEREIVYGGIPLPSEDAQQF